MNIRKRQKNASLLKKSSIAAVVALGLSSGVSAQELDEAERSQIEVIKGQTDVDVKQPAPS